MNRSLLLVLGLVALCALIWLLGPIFPPFILGLTMAYLLRPIVLFLTTQCRLPTFWGAFFLTLILYSVILLGIFLLVPSLKSASVFLSHKLLSYHEHFWELVSPWLEKLSAYSQEIAKIRESVDAVLLLLVKWAGGTVVNIFENGLSLARFVLTLMIAPLISFHLLKDWDLIATRIMALVPMRFREDAHALVTEMGMSLSCYLRGQMIVCLVLVVYYGSALFFADLDFGFLVGLGTGLGAFIPYLGFLAGLASALLIALFQEMTVHQILFILGIFVVGQALEAVVLTPFLIGKKTGIHPVFVLFAVFAGGILKGLTGVFLALPLATLLAAFWRFMKRRYIKTPFYLGKTRVPVHLETD